MKGTDQKVMTDRKLIQQKFSQFIFDRPASTVNECPDSPNIFHIKECISINMMASRCLRFMHRAFTNVNNVEINRCKWIQCTCTWRAENWPAMNFGFPFAFNLKWSKFNEYFLKFIAKHSFISGIKADTRKYRKFFFIKEQRNRYTAERKRVREEERERWNVINYYPIRSHNICSVYAVIKAWRNCAGSTEPWKLIRPINKTIKTPIQIRREIYLVTHGAWLCCLLQKMQRNGNKGTKIQSQTRRKNTFLSFFFSWPTM